MKHYPSSSINLQGNLTQTLGYISYIHRYVIGYAN